MPSPEQRVDEILDAILASLRAQDVTLAHKETGAMTGMQIIRTVEKVARDVVQSQQVDDIAALERVQKVLETYCIIRPDRVELIADLVRAMRGAS